MGTTTVGVVGAGIIGICTALQLQRQGCDVTLIDPKGFGRETSYGNAGHFATEQVFPLADPSLLPQLPKILLDPAGPFRVRPEYFLRALPWFMRFMFNMLPSRAKANTKAIRVLNEASIPAYQTLLASLGLEDALELRGSLLTFETTNDAKIHAMAEAFREEGVAVEYLNQKQAKLLEPKLAATVKACLYFSEVGHCADPGKLCQQLGEAFLTAGGELVPTKVQVIEHKSNEVLVQLEPYRLSVEEQSIPLNVSFDRLVIASGAWSKTFAEQLAYRVPLDTERGYHLMLPQTKTLSRPVASAERKFIMTPMSGGLRLAGTVEFAGLEAAADFSRAEMLLPHAQALLDDSDLAEQTLEHAGERWMGYRPSLPDSLPVMGQAPRHPRVFFNFGHQHLGLTWGALVGELIADVVVGKKPALDLHAYSIKRFNG